MDPRAPRLNRRHLVAALAGGSLAGFPLAQRGAAQTPVAESDTRWQTWEGVITTAPAGTVRWRALRYRAKLLAQAPFANRSLGFVWNDDGRKTLVVENATRGITRELDMQLGERAVSFNHEQDSEARRVRDDESQPWPYRYFNFDLVADETYHDKETRGDGELWGWSNPFTISGPDLHLSFGSITIAPREAAVYVPGDDPADRHPVFAMCLEGRFSPIYADRKYGPAEITPGDFVELSTQSPIAKLYGSGMNNVLVGVYSPGAGGIDVENLAS